ncbi:MAG: FHA domain-containing protein [Planctomycetales bacterium]|nr:FHA domain-containing protein [Planctomycetales bacterium]
MSRSTTATLAGYKISVIRQSASPIEHPLEAGRSVFIGRSDSCGIQVKGEGVADIHCLVDVEDDVVSIQDWASKAGTKVNGQLIDDKTPIQSGDSVVIGSVTFQLIGQPNAKKNSQTNKLAAENAAEPREESVGMENLGYESSEADAVAVAEPSPVVRPSVGRLSDSLAGSKILPHEADAVAKDDSSTIAESNQTPAHCDADLPGDELPAEVDSMDEASLDSFDDAMGLNDPFAPNNFSAEDLDWDPTTFDDDQVDAEIVNLLKSEIEDLRIQLAERDEQLMSMEGIQSSGSDQSAHKSDSKNEDEFAGSELVGRVDDLLAELAEHDERVAMFQELLQTAEIQNQAEREERNCLETWVGEIEQRIGERESEWQAEQDAIRGRLESACQQRDQFQQQLHAAAKRYGKGSIGEVVPDETLQKLQKQNGELQAALEESQKQCASLTRQIERLKNEEPESLQELRAELAQEKASVSRMRFQLSKQLQDIDSTPAPKDQPDREFAFKLQTLREHLREIHEEEKVQREQKGETLFGRISNLWKRVDDEF